MTKGKFIIFALIAVLIVGGISSALLGGNNKEQTPEQVQKFAELAGTTEPAPVAVDEQTEEVAMENPAERNNKYSKAPDMQLEAGKNYKAVITTSMGAITIDLYEELMPITVNNFVFLANAGYYDGVIFHRVIEGFMVQGGDPTGSGTGGPGYAIADEHKPGSTNVRGTISMANAGPNTGGSQFFINLVDNTRLDWDKAPEASKHPVFGEVVEGMDVVDAIGKVKTGARDRPVTDVVMEKVEIVAE